MKTNKKLYLLFLIFSLTALFSLSLKAQTRSVNCLESKIHFDVSSVEKIFFHPEEILKDIEGFWTTDVAYITSKRWHDATGVPIPREKWKNELRKIAELTEEERRDHPAVKLAHKIKEGEKVFLEKALPHICSFLPDDAGSLDRNVYFTAHTAADGFVAVEIVMNVTANTYHGDMATMLNTVVHEIWHTGFKKYRDMPMEVELENEELYSLLDNLQDEGLATYVAYKALPVFPAPYDKDYKRVESDSTVKSLHKNLNKLFAEATTLSKKELCDKGRHIGVRKRAFYIIGLIMAQTIHELKRIEALKQTMVTGPRYFVSMYNSIVDEEKKIVEFPAPKAEPLPHKLKIAILEKDMETFTKICEELKSNRSEIENSLENKINRFGYFALNEGMTDWALKIFTLNVELFPQSANNYDSLAEAYMKNGQNDGAIKNYKKSLELNPENTNAKAMVKKLEGKI